MHQNAAHAFTILNGQTQSQGFVNLGGRQLVALAIPSTYTGGNITIQAAITESGTYNDVYDSNGTKVTLTVGGSDRVVALTGSHLQALSSLQFIKITAASAVGADKVITCIQKG